MSNMEKAGRVPSGRVLVAFAVYAGLNLNDYYINFNDATLPEQPKEKSWTFRSALERIKQLEEELKRASQQTRNA